MKNRMRFFLGAATLLLLAALALQGSRHPGTAPQVKEITQIVCSDCPVYSSIEQMTAEADVILIGRYTEFLSTWNMDRNPENPAEEDPTSHSEGRLYSFEVKHVLKGGPLPDEITISKYYSFGSQYSQGMVGGVEQYAPCQIPTQYFVESEYGVDYLLFLDYNDVADNYYAIGEPWEIAIRPDGKADLKSNLFNPPDGMPATLETEIRNGDTVYKLIVSGTDIGRYEDFLSGMELAELKAAITAAQKPEPETVKEITQIVFSDCPVYSSIGQMTAEADVILIGRYREFLSTWNMDRNPEDPVEEDPNSYSEGRLYSFDVERVLKGEAVPDTIRINKAYSVGNKYSVGRIGGVEQKIKYQIPSQYFIEPTLDEPYLLFLCYSSIGDAYYACGEPSDLLILPDGGTELQSNLFNPEEGVADRLVSEAQWGGTTYRFKFHTSDIGSHANFLAGMTLAEVEAAVAAALEEAPAA